MSTYEFGIDSELSLPDELQVVELGAPAGDAIDDIQAATLEAVRSPLEFPPLKDIVVPGDRVTLALANELPRSATVIAAIIQELLDAGIEPDHIDVLRSEGDARLTKANPLGELPQGLRDQITVSVHDASERDCLGLLGISNSDQPIYLARQIVDADVVLPIGVVKSTGSLGDLGVYGTLFPTFADVETQQKLNATKSVLSQAEIDRRQEMAKEASWLLGVRMVVQLVPGAGDQLLHVLAGDADVVDRVAREKCDEIWQCVTPERASLVLATMPGSRQQQTWNNFARVLDSALRVVQDDGAIAVCCDLKVKPGPALKRVGQMESLDSAEQAIQKDRSDDALTAKQLVRTLQRARVYLLSQLDEDVVESLGVAYVSCPEELVRLASHHDSCILLRNAHQTIARVGENGEA